MIARAALLVVVVAFFAPRAWADPIVDATVVRSIERIPPDTSRITFDVDRPAIEQYLRLAIEQYLRTAFGGRFQGTQVQQVTVGGSPGSSTLSITVQLATVPPVGATGSLSGHLTLGTTAGNVVEAKLLLDSVSIGGVPPIPLNGAELAAARKQVKVPEVDGEIQRITIPSVEPSWIAVAIEVKDGPSSGAANAQPSGPVQTKVFADDSFERDEIIEAHECNFIGNVRVAGGKRLVIRCGILKVGEGAVIDGRGNPGAPGATGNDRSDSWTSTDHCGRNQGHKDWEAAGGSNDVGGDGGNGGQGRPGATVVISYKTLAAGSDPSKLKILVDGGSGGSEGPGGAGRPLRCGCHGEEKRGPRGRSGSRGSPGEVGSKNVVPNPTLDL